MRSLPQESWTIYLKVQSSQATYQSIWPRLKVKLAAHLIKMVQHRSDLPSMKPIISSLQPLYYTLLKIVQKRRAIIWTFWRTDKVSVSTFNLAFHTLWSSLLTQLTYSRKALSRGYLSTSRFDSTSHKCSSSPIFNYFRCETSSHLRYFATHLNAATSA